jgi:hypothetical protein
MSDTVSLSAQQFVAEGTDRQWYSVYPSVLEGLRPYPIVA